MKSLRIAAVGLVTALSLALFAPVASAADLGQMTPDTFKTADKPIIGVITGAGCKTCPDIVKALEAQAAKNPNAAFLAGESTTFDVDLADLPVLVVSVPGLGPTYVQKNFTLPADVDAFTKAQLDYVAKEAAAGATFKAAQAKLQSTNATFQAEATALQGELEKALEPINNRATPVLKPLADEQAALEAKMESTLGPLFVAMMSSKTEAEFNANKAKLEAAAAPFEAEQAALTAKLEAAAAPFQKEAEPILNTFKPRFEDLNARATKAIGEVQAEVAAARQALQSIVTDHRAGK